jgi:hypothetical protein
VLSRIKDASPRFVLDAADLTTRGYAMATAGLRPGPDFFIVGAKRGGTTSLWNWLDRHPQVLSMFPRPRGLKSTDYFFGKSPKSWRWYRSHFHSQPYRAALRRTRGRVVNGEASPYYMYGPHVPAQLAEAVPAARVIALLRDPVDRAYSHFQERSKQGVERLGFREALALEEGRIAVHRELARAHPEYYSSELDFFSYRDRGIYLPQLRRLHTAFPAGQVLVLLSEELYTDPQRAYDRVCDFLEIARHQLVAKRHNEIRRAPMEVDVRAELTSFFGPHNRELAAYLDRDLGWA